VGGAAAQEVSWRPAAESAAPRPPAATLGRPVASLGRSVPFGTAPGGPGLTAGTSATPAASLGPVIRCQAPDVPPPGVPAVPGIPAIPGPADDIYSHPPVPGPVEGGPGFWGKCGEYLGFGCGCPCQNFLRSDHCFDNFISPVTNPSEFEDPRSLTELRPIFIFQEARHHNFFFHDANISDYNLQARVALTDRFSIVMQKFGFIHLEPGNDSTFQDVTGFSEVDIGPKFTFWRNECTGTLAAAGLTFEIPAGPRKVFQDTGDLTLRPYLSFAQNFGRTSYGSFNFMSTFGYNFGVDNKRSDNFFTSWHLDFDVANAHKIYPLIELNWRHYTQNGKANNFDFEGGDLFNFGSEHVAGNDYLSLGPGVRYKFTEWAQLGTAVEFPLSNRKDLESFRWTFDLIFRY
jgi:hypothetical protein